MLEGSYPGGSQQAREMLDRNFLMPKKTNEKTQPTSQKSQLKKGK